MKYDKVIHGTSGSDYLNARELSRWNTLQLFGAGGDDTLIGADYMDGGAGNDTILDSDRDSIIFGGVGDDTIVDAYGSDRIIGGSGDDYVIFDPLNAFEGDKNEAFLGAGNDTGVIALVNGRFQQNIDGGSGFDTLEFFSGYKLDTSLDKVMDFRVLDSGSMTFDGSTVKDFERVIFEDTGITEIVFFGDFNDVFFGSGRNNRVYGFGGNDMLFAGAGGVNPNAGGDWLFGGEGNDIIVADGGTTLGFHRAFGEAGDDKIYGSFKHADYYSNGRLYGGSGKDGFIHTFNNTVPGRNGKFDYIMDFNVTEDWIGLATGGYFDYDVKVTRAIRIEKINVVDSANSLSFFLKNFEGDESLPVKIIYNKNNGNLYLQIELREAPTLILNIKGAPNLTADSFYYMTKQYGTWHGDLLHGDGQNNVLQGLGGNDIIYGSAGNDTIYGDGNDPSGALSGSDALYGDAGNDSIYGGFGTDKITGGLGSDHLKGDAGNDTFIYKSVTDSIVLPAGRDTIYDFTVQDKIDLSGIDANQKMSGNQAFSFIGTSSFSGSAGQLRFDKKVSDTYVYADVNGDKIADFSIHMDDAINLIKAYFVM